MPDALRLRFLAEVNQLDALQEAETRVDQIRLVGEAAAAKWKQVWHN